MNEELEQIVQNMIDAGESEENIALVIQSYKSSDPVKKKDGTKPQSPSTTPSVNTESGQKSGSLDMFPKPQSPTQIVLEGNKQIAQKQQAKTPIAQKDLTASEKEMGTMAWNLEKLKKVNPEIEKIGKEYLIAQKVDDNKVAQIKQEVEDEFNKSGFFNGLQAGAKKGWNTLVDVIGFGGSEETKSTWKADTDLFKKEAEEVKKKILIEASEAKANNKPAPIYTQEQINEMIKARRVKKLIDSERQSQVRSYLEDQESQKDKFGKTKRERMEIYKIQELSALSEKDAENLKKQNIVLPALSNVMTKLKDIKDKFDSGTSLTQEEVEQAKLDYNDYVKLSKQAIELKEEFANNRDKIKYGKQALDLFKRDYSFARHFKNLYASVEEIAGGIGGAIDYGYEVNDYVKKTLGIPTLPSAEDDETRMLIRGATEDVFKESKQLKSETAKPIMVEDINSFDDMGSWFADMVTSQAPIFATIATGAPGISTLGVSSTGQKYENMLEEMRPEPGKMIKNYSQEQLVGIPAIYGVTETASAMVDRYLMKTAQKTYNSMTSAERKLFADGMVNKLFKGITEATKGTVIEGLDEAATQFAQNLADKTLGEDPNKSLLEGVKDSFVAGAVMGGMIKSVPMVVAQATKPYTNKTDKSIQEQAKQIMEFQAQLDAGNISDASRKTIQEQLGKAKEKFNALLEKRVVDMSTLSNAQFNEIGRLEKAQANIKAKAEQIKQDTALGVQVKKQILENLKDEFKANEQRRVDLLERGASVQLEKLEESEVIRLKDKAQRQLMKELNPDGTKNITLNDEQISKRAIEIYKEEQLKSKQKDAETKIPTTETKIESETEVQEQPEVKEEVVYKQYKDLNQLESENKSTFPKIPTEKVFYSKPEVLPASEVSKADLFMEEGESEKLPSKEVDVRLIVPTQKNVTASNLKSVSKIKGDASEDIVLFEKEGKFYVLDGHHRIAKSILDGGEKIKARVFSETTQEPIAPKENDEVVLEPRIKGGLPRTIVFKDGEWQQKVGGQVSPISESVKKEAQIKFDETQTQRDITPDANIRPTTEQVGEVAVTEQPTAEVTKTEVVESAVEPRESKGFTDAKVINRDYAKIKAKLGDKKAKQYFDQVDKLFDPNNTEVVEYRTNGVVTKQGEDFVFNALSGMDTKNWRIAFSSNINEQFTEPTRKETRIKATEAKIDEIANSIKGLESVFGIKIKADTNGENIQGTSRDQLIDFIAKTAKEIAKTGITIDEAIRSVIAELKKSYDVDIEVDEVKAISEPKAEEKPQVPQLKGKPITSKESRREKSSEEIASELGVSHDDYLDLKELVANEPKSGKFNEYLSGETIADVFGDKPTNDQQYEQLVLLNAIQHGNAVLDKAKKLFGQDYFTKTLQFLQDAKLPNFEKSVVYAAMENEIDTLVKSNPDNNILKETQRLIYADSQANLRNSSKGINAGRLRRIHNAIKKGYDVEKLVSGIVTPAQEEAKEVLRNAVPSGENLNKVSETEESAETQGKKYTQEEFEEALKKAIEEFRSKSRSDLSKKGKDIADKIRRLKLNKDVARADLSLGAYDLAIEAIAQLVEKGSTVAQAIKNVLSDPQFSQIDADKLREDILGVVRTPKIRDIVKQSLIDAGFSREITVTKNAKDEFGNDIVEDGKKVKVKEKKQVLDWVKLTGRMNTVEALRKNVEPQLRSQGYTDSQIEEISSELEAEYVRLTESIAERAMSELERRNQITPSPNRKSDLDRLVEYHSKGLFSQDAAKYERLINKIVGVSQRDQDVLDKIETEIEKIKNLREVKIDGKYPDAKTIETQASHIAQAIRNIIAWANLRNSPIKNKAIVIISDLAGISRAAVLGNLYNAFQNIYSNWRAGFLAKAKFKTKGYYTKQLNEAFNELQNVITADVLANRGLDFGDTVSPFSHHSLFVEKAKDYITKNFSGSKQRAFISLMNAFEGRLFLNIMDSRYKSKIVNIDFVMNLVDVLTSERQGKQKMTKEEAVEFVSNSLTGVNLEKAKELAKKFIADVNDMQEGTLLEDDATVNRLAFDIVRENLTSGNYFSMEEINEIYEASMRSGGLNIGHESNNIVSERIKFENNRIEKKIEDALKEKDYDKAAKYGTYALVMKNILYPYMSGGMNWAFIEAEAGTPIGLITGAIKTRSNKPIDLLTDQGKKKLKETLKNKRDAESKLFRGIWGTSIGVSAYLAYQGLKALSVAGDDDEENKRLFNQYLKEHPEQRKIFDKFSPEIYAYSLAVSDKRLPKYLLNKMGYKTDQSDNVLTLINSLQNKNSSSMGALGVLLGQVFSTPGSWRIIRDTQRLSRELKGEPMNQTQVKVTSFLNGYFKGAFIDYIGKRPGVNYDLERVRKEFENERTKFTKYTNSIADDIVEGNLTVEEAQKVLEKKYSDKPELLKKAIKIASDAINDQKIRDGLRDADTWYMELYNEKNAYAKAYVYYQNVLKDKTPKEVERITQDKDFAKNINLATATMSKEMQSDFLDLVIQFKDVEEQKKSK